MDSEQQKITQLEAELVSFRLERRIRLMSEENERKLRHKINDLKTLLSDVVEDLTQRAELREDEEERGVLDISNNVLFRIKQELMKTTVSERESRMRSAIETFLEQNDTEGFGCACTPNHTCGPCSAFERQQVLRNALKE